MYRFFKLFAFLLLSILTFNSCKHKSKSTKPIEEVKVIFEKKVTVDSKLLGIKFWVTDEEKYNGHETIKLNTDHKYGLTIKLQDLNPDAFVRITVWEKGGSEGRIALTGGEIDLFEYSSQVLKKGDNGWNKIILETYLPPTYNHEPIKVYVMNDDKNPAYFSDLKVTVYNRKPYPDYDNKSSIEFLIKAKDLNYINKKRIKSFERGVITKKTKREFDAIAIINGSEFPVTMRIKGDWLDHIQGNKWSFRIKMKKGVFRGMKEFSIQQPPSRGYLNEYVLHKILEHEDVLTTRYGFIPVKINGNSLGIYAYEEHFEKRLIESRKRREGPILKFDEAPMWNVSLLNQPLEKDFVTTPTVETAIIVPFKKKKTMGNPTLKEQFLIGQNLLNQYRYDETPVSELFKIEELAKLYAITEIGISWHAIRWHNQRFYYDPVASKLEVIAFDCYAFPAIKSDKPWLTPLKIYDAGASFYDSYLTFSPFNDNVFLKQYLATVSDYLFTDKILRILDENRNEIEKYETWIKKEYAFYNYDYDLFKNSIDSLKPEFRKLEKKLKINPPHIKPKFIDYKYGNPKPVEGFALQGFAKSFGIIEVKNINSKTLYLIGYSSKKKAELGISNFEEPIEFSPYKNLKMMDRKEVQCLYTPDKIYFKTDLNDTTIFNTKVIPWPEPGHSSPRQELLKNPLTKTTEYARVENGVISFKPGKYEIKKPIVIPAGYKVIIRSNTHLDFVENAFFMSFSPVEITGTATQNVIIESSDGTGMGFTIIDAQGRSEIKHVRFKGWNTLNYQGWILTGAVTFYESDVDIESTEFLNNNCEDALNVVRADFSLKHSLIANTFADGFDADFTTGLVYDCDFKQIGNDGIDYSGSEIKIENVRIDGAGDKGISGGEASTLVIKNVVISNSNIGVASKDDSNLKIENIKLINCNCGFAAYQKKTEYGPAEMNIEGCSMENVNDVYMLGLESVINLDGDVNKGDTKLNIDSLYAQ